MATINIESPEWIAFQAEASAIYSDWLTSTPGTLFDDEPEDYSELDAKMAELRSAYGWTDEAVAEAEKAAYNAVMADDTYVERQVS